MKQLASFVCLFLIVSCCALLHGAENDSQLELRVYAETMHSGDQFEIEVRSFIFNKGSTPITVPTSTYSGHPGGMREGGPSLWFLFDVGYGEVGGLRMSPSPNRYFPVTLEPNDITELPLITFRTKSSDFIKTVSVSYHVDADFGKRYGWWSGSLRAQGTVGGDSPFKVKVEMSEPLIEMGDKKNEKQPNQSVKPTPANGHRG
jgi:hypothetical protein